MNRKKIKLAEEKQDTEDIRILLNKMIGIDEENFADIDLTKRYNYKKYLSRA